MYTQCPICDTLFALNIAQLKVAQGKVRCGHCQVIFNALLNLSEEIPRIPTVAEKIASSTPDKIEPDTAVSDAMPILMPAELSSEPASFGFTLIDEAAQDKQPASNVVAFNPPPELAVEPEAWLDTPALEPIAIPEPDWQPDTKTEFALNKEEMQRLGLIASDEVTLHPDNVGEQLTPYGADIDFAAPVPLTPLLKIVPHPLPKAPQLFAPDQLTAPNRRTPAALDNATIISRSVLQDYAPRHRKTFRWQNTAVWSLGILGLLVLLIAQVAYFMRAELAQYPALRPALETLCTVFNCDVPLTRDLNKIELLNRDVRRHPTIQDALLVTVTLVNRAPFTQPYPDLQVTLANLNETTVAKRRFRPVDYLDANTPIAHGMTPESSVPMVLEIAAPSINFQLASWNFALY